MKNIGSILAAVVVLIVSWALLSTLLALVLVVGASSRDGLGLLELLTYAIGAIVIPGYSAYIAVILPYIWFGLERISITFWTINVMASLSLILVIIGLTVQTTGALQEILALLGAASIFIGAWLGRKTAIITRTDEFELTTGLLSFQIPGGFLFFMCGVWALFLSLGIIVDELGFIGGVIGFMFFPVTVTVAPWYAALADNNWGPFLLSYGGMALTFALFSIGWIIDRIRQPTAL